MPHTLSHTMQGNRTWCFNCACSMCDVRTFSIEDTDSHVSTDGHRRAVVGHDYIDDRCWSHLGGLSQANLRVCSLPNIPLCVYNFSLFAGVIYHFYHCFLTPYIIYLRLINLINPMECFYGPRMERACRIKWHLEQHKDILTLSATNRRLFTSIIVYKKNILKIWKAWQCQ